MATNVAKLNADPPAVVAGGSVYSKIAAVQASLARTGIAKSFPGMPVEMKVSNEEGFPHKGALDFVDNQVDTETSTVELRGVFPNADMKLTPGLFARVRIPAREKYEAPWNAMHTVRTIASILAATLLVIACTL